MEEFFDWFVDWVKRLAQALFDAARVAVWIALIVLSSPMWLLPFAYWFIFVRKKEEET